MPVEYEKIRDSLLSQGKSTKDAKRIAAAIYNSRHPGNPNPWQHEGHMKKKKKGKKKKGY